MSQSPEPRAPQQQAPGGDPWTAFGYLVGGLLLYGGIGWLLDRWLGTSFLVVVGIFVGISLALYVTFVRWGKT